MSSVLPLLPSVTVTSCLVALGGIVAWSSVLVDTGIGVSFALLSSSSWAFEQSVIPRNQRDTALPARFLDVVRICLTNLFFIRIIIVIVSAAYVS